jgi:hypothetical protein
MALDIEDANRTVCQTESSRFHSRQGVLVDDHVLLAVVSYAPDSFLQLTNPCSRRPRCRDPLPLP